MFHSRCVLPSSLNDARNREESKKKNNKLTHFHAGCKFSDFKHKEIKNCSNQKSRERERERESKQQKKKTIKWNNVCNESYDPGKECILKKTEFRHSLRFFFSSIFSSWFSTTAKNSAWTNLRKLVAYYKLHDLHLHGKPPFIHTYTHTHTMERKKRLLSQPNKSIL